MKNKIKNVGIDASKPEKTCNDMKCPWHGHLKVRGRIFEGRVESTRASKTAIIEWGYTHYIAKYERYERRHSRVAAYKPDCIDLASGNIAKIAECRTISKAKKFVVVERIK